MTRYIAIFFAIMLAAAASGCSGGPSGPPPNVIVITLDTTRADHLGCYGNKAISTPNFDRFASGAIRFANCFSTCNSTLPSHTSIFTSLYMRDHGVHHNRQRVPDIDSIMPRVFKRHGYETAGFTSGGHLNSVANIDQGYDHFQAPPGAGLEAPAGLTNEEIYDWLNTRRPGDGGGKKGPAPLFMWVHYFDAHFTYDPPEPFRDMYKFSSDERMEVESRSVADPNKKVTLSIDPAEYRGLYMGEISYMDSEFGRLMDDLRRRGLYDNSIIVVVADHGESLGEHDIYWNHAGLYDTTLHVPLMIKPPTGTFTPGVRDGLVSSIDIYPTVMELAGISVKTPVAGKSLTGVIRDPKAGPVRDMAFFQDLHEETIGIRTDKYLYLRQAYDDPKSPDRVLVTDPGNRFLLYDSDADPGQNTYINYQRPDVAAKLDKAALDFLEHPIADYRAREVTDKKQVEKLKALGYVQ